MRSTWEWSEQYQNWNGPASCRLHALVVDYIISDVRISSLCNHVAWICKRKNFSGTEELIEQRQLSACLWRASSIETWYDFMHLIIKACSSIRCRFVLFISLFLFLLLLTLYQLSPLIYFRARLNQFSFLFFFFCSFWHPTKLIASEGIGVEGPVLFWQFFQERPSIRWSIVLETDLSLLNSWLAARSRCCKGIESLQGTL